MNPSQFSQFWVGCGFAIFLVIFAVVAFFRRGKLEAHQWALLRFLLALCAGFAGGLISGEALFKLVQNWGVNNQMAVSGTAGFALFFTVWFTFPQLAGRPVDDYAFSLPDGWTFQDAATEIARQDQAVTDLSVFNAAELIANLKAGELRTKNVINALVSLQRLAAPGTIRRYTVSFSAPTYTFRLL
jgi:hypothetical protein